MWLKYDVQATIWVLLTRYHGPSENIRMAYNFGISSIHLNDEKKIILNGPSTAISPSLAIFIELHQAMLILDGKIASLLNCPD